MRISIYCFVIQFLKYISIICIFRVSVPLIFSIAVMKQCPKTNSWKEKIYLACRLQSIIHKIQGLKAGTHLPVLLNFLSLKPMDDAKYIGLEFLHQSLIEKITHRSRGKSDRNNSFIGFPLPADYFVSGRQKLTRKRSLFTYTIILT